MKGNIRNRLRVKHRAPSCHWIAIVATVVGGIAASASQQSATNKQNVVKYEDQRDLSNLALEQQNWLSQQQRKWNLEDYQRGQNYKENAIGGFRDAALPNAVKGSNGQWGTPPAPTTVDTSGLAPTQDNGQPAIFDPRTGAPINNKAPPLAQFG
jgi:hypothetical protein